MLTNTINTIEVMSITEVTTQLIKEGLEYVIFFLSNLDTLRIWKMFWLKIRKFKLQLLKWILFLMKMYMLIPLVVMNRWMKVIVKWN